MLFLIYYTLIHMPYHTLYYTLNIIYIGKVYYAHLFNDCLMWSQVNNAGKYKLNRAWELDGSNITPATVPNQPYSFLLTTSTSIEREIFTFPTYEIYNNWYKEIDTIIQSFNNIKNESSSLSNRLSYSSHNNSYNNNKPLGPRGNIIQKFLISETKLSELLISLNLNVFQPMIEASHGGTLYIPNSANSGNSSKIGPGGSVSPKPGKSGTYAILMCVFYTLYTTYYVDMIFM